MPTASEAIAQAHTVVITKYRILAAWQLHH